MRSYRARQVAAEAKAKKDAEKALLPKLPPTVLENISHAYDTASTAVRGQLIGWGEVARLVIEELATGGADRFVVVSILHSCLSDSDTH